MTLSVMAVTLRSRSKDDVQGRHVEAEVVVQAVSWSLRCPLSDRCVEVDHGTANRRGRSALRRSRGGSGRVDPARRVQADGASAKRRRSVTSGLRITVHARDRRSTAVIAS